MKVAVIGSGGREHAIVKGLSQSSLITGIHAYPGSVGMSELATCHAVSWNPLAPLIKSLKGNEIELVVVGPEAPLVEGVADVLRQEGFLVFGPDKAAAMLEGSKIFCKQFMQQAGVPTADYKVATNYDELIAVSKDFDFPFVVKADGLAAGKGVYVCSSQDDLGAAALDIFRKQIFGKTQALVETFLSGWELSYIIITDGERYGVCPLAQDHKTLLEAGAGPNTGGMGVFGPVEISQTLNDKIKKQVIEPTLAQFKKLGLSYRGALFVGLMIYEDEPHVLEYNVRFGDPETQIIVPLIDGDLAEILISCAKGELVEFKAKSQSYASCVVMAAKGYPIAPEKGAPISGDMGYQTDESYFIHAGVGKHPNGEYFVSGGRVLGAIGLGNSKEKAIKNAYLQLEQVNWEGMQFRRDIGNYFNQA